MKNVFQKIWVYIHETDILLLFLCVSTSIFGIVAVFSATQHDLSDGETIPRDALVMAGAIALGIIIAIAISFIDFEIIAKLWPIIAGGCLVLMLLLFVIGVGPSGRSDVKSWIKLGSLVFQPSELLKAGFIITFSVHLEAVKENINKFSNVILLGLHGMIPLGLVVLTGDLGSALVFACMLIGMMFIAGVKFKYFALIGGVGVVVVPVVWVFFLSEFQKNRLLAVYYPQVLDEKTYKDIILQQERALNAIGSGGLKGSGLFKGIYTSAGYIPESENDMIFTVIGEELGFIGATLVLVLLAVIILRIIIVGTNTKSDIGKMMCFGTALMIASQVIINIGMCLKLLPVIGITLPFFSAGGSSNLCLYITLGLVFSVYRSSRERKPVDFRLTRVSSPFSQSI